MHYPKIIPLTLNTRSAVSTNKQSNSIASKTPQGNSYLSFLLLGSDDILKNKNTSNNWKIKFLHIKINCKRRKKSSPFQNLWIDYKIFVYLSYFWYLQSKLTKLKLFCRTIRIILCTILWKNEVQIVIWQRIENNRFEFFHCDTNHKKYKNMWWCKLNLKSYVKDDGVSKNANDNSIVITSLLILIWR